MAEPQSEQSREDLQAEIDALKQELQQLQSDLRGVTDHFWDVGRQSYETASRTAQETFGVRVEQLEQSVKRQPLTTVATAFVAGVVLGKLFGRR
jgi:ElaB/YqjD/DUF883 family membrane-anchored ribosome-binding protein